jgi:tol-pal system protein YbgF
MTHTVPRAAASTQNPAVIRSSSGHPAARFGSPGRISAFAAALLLGGCFYPADRGKLLEAKLQRLEGDNQRLVAELEKARGDLLPRVEAKIEEVTRALEKLDQASRRSDADTGVLLQKTIEDVAALRGELETSQHRISELRAALDAIHGELDKKVVQILGPEAAKQYEARRKMEEIERPSDPKAFLQLAQGRARAGDSSVARRLYDEFFKKFPKHELSGEAHFGLGEMWRGEDRCREALFEYGKVIQEYPKTAAAPQAYIRSSECFTRLKMNEEARLALEEVVKSHPKSEAARTAKARIAELDKTSKKPAAKKGKK